MIALVFLAQSSAGRTQHQKAQSNLEKAGGAPRHSYYRGSRNEADQSIEVIQTQINRRRRMSQRTH